MEGRLTFGPFWGGGIVVGYRCSSTCRHCLYGCGPHRLDGFTGSSARVEQLLDQLVEHASHARFHIGGGEPFLHEEPLLQLIAGMPRRGLLLDYVETNASWATSEDKAVQTLQRCRAAGLESLLISVSPFHAEFVPFERTLTLIQAAHDVLSNAPLVWIPDFIHDLSRHPTGETLDLDHIFDSEGEHYALGLALRYGLVAGGRAGRFMAAHGAEERWDRLSDSSLCKGRLSDTTHFHVDLEGGYVPGLCAGISVPFSEVVHGVLLERYPILAILTSRGTAGLVDHASTLGFEPLEVYSSACDLCTHVRHFLFHCPEADSSGLGPPGFYDPKSIPAFV